MTTPNRLSPHVRVLAVDDAPFARKKGARVPLVGVLCRGARHVEGVFSTAVVRDGWGATAAIADMVLEYGIAVQARFILLDGVAVGGFNVVDLPALHARTGVPAVAVIRREPDMAAVARALERVSRPAARMAAIRRAGVIHRAASAGVWFQCAGCAPEHARDALAAVTVDGKYPEPLRLAHLIGAGMVLGRSRGGA